MLPHRVQVFAKIALSVALAVASAHGPHCTLAAATTTGGSIYPGIDVLEKMEFRHLRQKRVGLLTHPAGVNRMGVSTIEVLRQSPKVRLVALFGPEHGIYGDEKANVPVAHRTDRRTGLPVYSLYGKYREPTPKMLTGIDVMVVDLQDLGVRSYTYAAAMKKTIEACFKLGKEVIVLDRPNPIGGLKVDGPPMEKQWMSYVGAFRTPYVHGLTIGELARMAARLPGWLDVDERVRSHGRLTVIPMQGWRRNMLWTDTGLRWVPTSPAIPDLSAALGYAMTGLGAQLGGFQHGYGTAYPFRLLTFPGKEPEAIVAALRAKSIDGLDFQIIRYVRSNGVLDRGVYLKVTDWGDFHPTQVSFHMMQLAARWSRSNPFSTAPHSAVTLFNKHVGSTDWWKAISTQGAEVNTDAFLEKWRWQAQVFQSMSRKFWLYR
jgi:uncharacterized protein YbbC (DUF1343 family)